MLKIICEGMEVVITNLIDNLTDFPASDVKSFEPSDFKISIDMTIIIMKSFQKLEYVKGNTKGYSNRIIYVVEKYRTLIKNLMKPGFYDIVFAEFDQVVTDFPSYVK